MLRQLVRTIILILPTLTQPLAAQAQLTTHEVASGLVAPVAFVQMPSAPQVQAVVEQIGRVRLVQNGALRSDFYLDLSNVVTSGGERGLLGLAFSPNYAVDGRVFVNFTNRNGDTVVSRFTCTQDLLHANPATRADLVWPGGLAYIPQPYENHNGGNIAFGPDGYLYIGMGDGGAGDDPFHNAQNPMSLLGKMLRIDVSVSDSDPQGYDVPPTNPFFGRNDVLTPIWSFGLRNPWRWSFDNPALGGNGALIIGDVGQGSFEEIDYEPAGAGGRNYGWRNREGAHPHVTDLAPFSNQLTDPILEYGRETGRTVIGGFVYRGQALGATYRGRYFFGDYVMGRFWTLGLNVNSATGEATAANLIELPDMGLAGVNTSSFGVDAAGEIYMLSLSAGAVFKLVLAGGSTPAPSSCSTPDPFVSMGGGTCTNGGWMPGPPSGSPPPSSNPPPSTPPPSGSCLSPDPFTSMGGGVCVNGGWLPQDATSNPSPSNPPPSGSCTMPDPFTSMGGGTCANGGWLPPGAASPPPPPPPSGGCVGPDPFASLPGYKGQCVNGGWTPVPR